jgi:hypothetical protein
VGILIMLFILVKERRKAVQQMAASDITSTVLETL